MKGFGRVSKLLAADISDYDNTGKSLSYRKSRSRQSLHRRMKTSQPTMEKFKMFESIRNAHE